MKAEVASTLFCCPPSLFSPFYVLCQLTSHLQLHKALGTTFISLITCVCQPAPYLPIHTHTHTHAVGLRFQGSYDTIQILLAAYSKEMCFAWSYFPQKSKISLPSSFDRSTWHRGLCQQSCVSAGGPSGPPRCQSFLDVSMTAIKHYVALSPALPKTFSKTPKCHMAKQMCSQAKARNHHTYIKSFFEVGLKSGKLFRGIIIPSDIGTEQHCWLCFKNH